ncbi:MAG: hypothetical protein WDN31_10855 [Hyphomicrobium sp.]
MEAPKLVNVIARAYTGRSYTSTQEQAWLLLAANALSEEGRDLKLIVNGAPVVGAVTRAMSAEELLKSPLTVSNDGDAPVDAVVSVIGSALTAEPPVSKGLPSNAATTRSTASRWSSRAHPAAPARSSRTSVSLPS